MFENPLRKLAEKRVDLQRISDKLAEAGRKGIELSGFAKELLDKEIALARSEAKYKALAALTESVVDNIPDYIWAKDLERRYLFSNKALRTLFRIEHRDGLLGKTEAMLVADKIASGCPVDIQDIIIEQTGHEDGSDIYIKRGTYNGVFFAWQVHRAALTNDKNEIVGTVSVARDVTNEYKEIV